MAEPRHAVMADRRQRLAAVWPPLANTGPLPRRTGAHYLPKPRALSRTHAPTFSLSTAFSHAHRGTTERRRAIEQLRRRLAPAPLRHCRLHLAASLAVFPFTSSTWLQRRTSYGEGEIAVPVLAGELGFHGRLHGELAAVELACAFLLIPCIRAWVGCALACSMMLQQAITSPAWNTMRSAAALSPPRHRAHGQSSSEHLA